MLGTVDARFVSDTNPFGINPDDPHGRDDVLIASPELHLPMGKPVKADLRSIDVLHDFTVPQFRAKMNMVPGLVTYVWFTPTRTGTFDAFCEQLCGIAHFRHARQSRRGRRERVSGVVEAAFRRSRRLRARGRRRRGGRQAALRGVCCLSWRASGGAIPR